MQGFVSPIGCVEDACACRMTEDCVAREIWVDVTDAITEVLKKFTVADLVSKHGENCKACASKKKEA
jgi:DNA-binding IscR family transcriptional regulator